MRSRCAVALLAAIATLAAAGWPAVGQTPKRGGILNAMLMEDPPGFSIHESSTISGVWPVAPCYSNLVTFDPLKPVESVETVIAELAERCVGTGPFRLKEYTRGQMIELERNPEYFVKDRPYLDGIRYPIITERGTRLAALQTGRLDTGIPLEMTKLMAETIKKNVPSMIVTESGQHASDNGAMTHKNPT